MFKQKIRIEHVDASILKQATYNPRMLTPKDESDLTESIKRFGLIDPIIVNSNKERANVIVGGHQRLMIALRLGYQSVPVVYLNLTEKQEKELNLRLNKNVGSWDIELLKQLDIELLLDVGFDDLDLSALWDEHLETEDDYFNTEKESQKAKTTDIKIGDMFALGSHKLICADSIDQDSIKRLMGDEKANTIYSDPPFNIGLSYSKGIGGKGNYCGIVNDKKSEKEYREFIKKTIENGLSVSNKDLHIFYYCDPLAIGTFQQIYKELGIINKRVIMWIKNNQNPTPQVAFNRSYEPVIYGTVGKPYLSNIKNFNEIMNKEVETGNRTIDDILDLLDIWLIKRLPTSQYIHPTEKSPTLHEKALRRCTKINDIVLDLFAGSGSTLIACEQLKRRCYTAELNPIFCQLIINRYETYASTKAKKLN